MKRASPEPVVQVVQGNLLDATEQYIAQQCNCYTVRGHGLSATIAKHFGPSGDPYATRKAQGRRNLAIPEDRDVPGTIRVLNERIICMFAQLCPGKPGKFTSYPKWDSDTAKQREKWFEECLGAIEEICPTSVAFPWTIGCGLAGGDWATYKQMIEEFAERTGILCTLYKID